MTNINELFEEFDSDIVTIADFGLRFNGVLLTHIVRNEEGDISFWSGHPIDGKDSEEIVLPRNEWKKYCELVIEDFD